MLGYRRWDAPVVRRGRSFDFNGSVGSFEVDKCVISPVLQLVQLAVISIQKVWIARGLQPPGSAGRAVVRETHSPTRTERFGGSRSRRGMEDVAEKSRQYRHAPDDNSGGLLGNAVMPSVGNRPENIFSQRVRHQYHIRQHHRSIRALGFCNLPSEASNT